MGITDCFVFQLRYKVQFNRDGKRESGLFRAKADGRLEWLRFSEDYKYEYRGIRNYCCAGQARKDQGIFYCFSNSILYIYLLLLLLLAVHAEPAFAIPVYASQVCAHLQADYGIPFG